MIFVTGGTGLVGSHLLFELAKQGKKIRALKRPSSNLGVVKSMFSAYSDTHEQLYSQIEWVDGDIEDYHSISDALKGVDEVYHCAAMVSFNKRDVHRMLEINVGGTANIVDASIEAGIAKFCHVSSVASLGSSVDGSPVNEKTLWGKSKGKSGYAVSKFRSEMEVWRGIELGLNAVIVNPSVVLGPGQWNSGSGLLFGTIAKGFPFYTLGITGYVDVRDVVKAMLIAMKREKWGKRYLLNGENISHREVFSLIANAMGKKPPSIKVTPLMSSLAWPLAWFVSIFTKKAPAITRDTARSGHSKTFYSSALAEEELGIQFGSISEAVKNTVRVGRL
ncbi:MAG: nucleoside-diphosphate sugar epimerase [Bacteroidetes bacterium HGW-Bacteroidetes-15]|nr:MAG: nucleoside-diphosphate sugar epimerase [Bacteroidetes bacterium HGW-Bacteroidetes-15]